LLVAATPGSAAYFSKRFSTRSARKIYWALVAGIPEVKEGLIDLPLAKQPGTGGEKMMVDKSDQGQPAKSRYRVIDRAGNRAAWVELQPFTGRTHQLRVHMAAIGHPIIGDGKYGGPEAFLSGSISRKMHLHARRLIIDHPDGAPLDITAELPPHFAASLAQLGFDEADGDTEIEMPVRDVKEVEKSAAKAHAKQYRKERRGERRGRKSGERAPSGKAGTRTEAPKKRGPTKGKGSPAPTAKRAAPSAAKPSPRPKSPARPKGPAKPGGAPRKPR
ncbi:MAG: pseudouridine synthase, partial [Novosphingobium sp.]